ncbi:hypothetical protein VNO78_33675 [Psophocarpus tetragonolobus]|uniref:Uncharacterized protein n=1 Tax=Psophocarpus tetragonolobus TaxID=3891 RepID=A0AAN9NXF3_PSOTE
MSRKLQIVVFASFSRLMWKYRETCFFNVCPTHTMIRINLSSLVGYSSGCAYVSMYTRELVMHSYLQKWARKKL